jgi:alpha-tubulin suppressor-like RCC1 family protein
MVYSWGRNEQGFLGRESKTDLRKMLSNEGDGN